MATVPAGRQGISCVHADDKGGIGTLRPSCLLHRCSQHSQLPSALCCSAGDADWDQMLLTHTAANKAITVAGNQVSQGQVAAVSCAIVRLAYCGSCTVPQI
jgi:hypothetical protein